MGRGNVRVALVVLLVVAAVGLAGCRLASRLQQAGSTAGPDTEYIVTIQDVASGTSVSGTIHPTRSAALSAQAQAKVTAVYVKEGDPVTAG
ncbi:MAG TPA: RND transporter, partial [Clostridia bacterium]|nr:RND transporter [Clostridia bacterium]